MNGDCVIIGGCGFLGGVLTRRLAAQGRRVVVIDRHPPPATSCDTATYLRADIRERDALLDLAGACPAGAWVVNLAARQYQDAVPRRRRQAWFSEVNVDGALHVCELAVALDAAGLVQFSSDMVYGLPRALPVAESHPQHPLGEYGRSKVRMERQVREFARAHDLPATIFRPRLISGQGRLGVFSKLFSLIHRHLPLPLVGDGRNFYQMVAVEDCAAAVVCALDKRCPSAVYNLCSEPTLPVRDLMRELIRAVGSRSRVIPTPAALVRGALRTLSVVGVEPLYPEQYLLADRDFIVSAEKARAELDWQPHGDDLALLVAAYDFWKQLPRTSA